MTPIAAGTRFGRLVVIELCEERTAAGKRQHLCQCDCGKQTVVCAGNLKNGRAQSCGCLSTERAATMNRRHGPRKHPLYTTWLSMRTRCNNPNVKCFPYYGGRGIKVDPRWDDFAQFVADMGPKPSPRHTLDRINPDGPYAPENCRWASWHEQRTNRARGSAR